MQIQKLLIGALLILNLSGCNAGDSTGRQKADIGFSGPRPDILIADFEGDDYGTWRATGQAFGSGPARGTLPDQMPVSGYTGRGLVNSFAGGDHSTGRLASPSFMIKRPYINFLIGGGGHVERTCMNLLADGTVVRTAVGPNIQPGGSEQLDWLTWDVGDIAGRTVQIEIVDDHTGGWGHINVDDIVQSDQPRQTWTLDYQKAVVFNQRYLNIPVQSGAAKRVIEVVVEGRLVRQFDVELATEKPDFWVFLDVSEFDGKKGSLRIDRYDRRWAGGFDAIFQAATFPGQDSLYREPLRPQFHFTSRRGWLNDTNGMVYYDGEYHLFYQHNPFGWNWGNMSWGHAVSPDMIHWTELPAALHPDALGTIYSGSAVVDEHNTAGFQTGGEKTLVAIFTSAGNNSPQSRGKPFTQSIAYSTDRGRTWTRYPGNPVIGPIAGGTRDPKVFWHQPSGRWVMVLWIDGKTLSVFTSADLKTWQKMSDIEGFFECPELFELPVDGDPARTKWVVYGASGDYAVGDFNGREFSAHGDLIRFQYGNCFYASQTFNGIDASDGRRIQMGWGRGIEMPKMPFNQMILFPVELTLRTTEEGIRLFTEPIREIQTLHLRGLNWSDLTVGPDSRFEAHPEHDLLHIRMLADCRQAERFSIGIGNAVIDYDVQNRRLTCANQMAPLTPIDGKITLELLVDRMSVEIFANNGRVYMPIGIPLADRPDTVTFTSQGGDTRLETLDIFPLKSIWPR